MQYYCDACYSTKDAAMLACLAGYWFCESCYAEATRLTDGLFVCTTAEIIDILWPYVRDRAKVLSID